MDNLIGVLMTDQLIISLKFFYSYLCFNKNLLPCPIPPKICSSTTNFLLPDTKMSNYIDTIFQFDFQNSLFNILKINYIKFENYHKDIGAAVGVLSPN